MRAGDGSGTEVTNRLLDAVVVNGKLFTRNRSDGLIIVASRNHPNHHAAGSIRMRAIAGLACNRGRQRCGHEQRDRKLLTTLRNACEHLKR
jgi:hypothetical protein